jgi:hypothetical protein
MYHGPSAKVDEAAVEGASALLTSNAQRNVLGPHIVNWTILDAFWESIVKEVERVMDEVRSSEG